MNTIIMFQVLSSSTDPIRVISAGRRIFGSAPLLLNDHTLCFVCMGQCYKVLGSAGRHGGIEYGVQYIESRRHVTDVKPTI